MSALSVRDFVKEWKQREKEKDSVCVCVCVKDESDSVCSWIRDKIRERESASVTFNVC